MSPAANNKQNEPSVVAPKILSLDYSGPRGLSALYVLKGLMEQVQKKEERDELPRPCDYFDLIGGVGNGGVIATLLGRLSMSVDECIAAYKEIVEEALQDPNSEGARGLSDDFEYGFSEMKLAIALQRMVGERLGNQDTPLHDDKCTYTMVLPKRKLSPQDPVIFKTYGPAEEISDDGRYPISIWEVARAISATPVLFKPLKLPPAEEWMDDEDDEDDDLVNASFDTECLSEVLYREAKGILFPQCQTMKMFSIGPSIWDWYPNREPSDGRHITMNACVWELEKDTKFKPNAEHREVKVEYCRLNAYFWRGVREASEWRDFEGQLKQAQGYLKERETIKKFDWILRKP